MHFGENQLSPGSLGISPLPTAHPDILQRDPVRPSTRVLPRASAWPWVAHPVSGRRPRLRLVALFGLAFAPAPAVSRLSLATRRSLVGSFYKKHAVTGPSQLRPAVGARFQDLFHSPRRGAFHLSLTVLVRYRSRTGI